MSHQIIAFAVIVFVIAIVAGLVAAYWKHINDFRAKHLFITAKEADAAVRMATEIGENVAQALYAEKMAQADAERKRLVDLFVQMNAIKLDVNGRSQMLQITLELNRKTLRLLDIEDASRLLAARTEVIYRDAIKKRLNAKLCGGGEQPTTQLK